MLFPPVRHSTVILCILTAFGTAHMMGLISTHSMGQPLLDKDRITPHCDLQIFGDLYLSAAGLQETDTSLDQPAMFEGVKTLLDSCTTNIVNFEGVATSAQTPWEEKQFLLKMPLSVPALLKKVNIDILTLANNHTMDFGLLGLNDTLTSAQEAGLATVGAGITPKDSLKPLRLVTKGGTRICLGAFSSTFPESFWSDKNRGGTAYASAKNIAHVLSQCGNDFRIAIFHWGTERSSEPHLLQKNLAAFAIDSGADMVIGHHPHVLQPLEYYRGKPVFFSLGNFVFNSRPSKSSSQGMGVRLRFMPQSRIPLVTTVPLLVRPDIIGFIPRPFGALEVGEVDKIFATLVAPASDPSIKPSISDAAPNPLPPLWTNRFLPESGWTFEGQGP